MKHAYLVLPVLMLSACAEGPVFGTKPDAAAPPPVEAAAVRPAPRPANAPISLGTEARSAEALDGSTAAERAAASASAPPAGGPLGTTIASLGDPTEQGFWLKTPLVKAPQKGKVVLGDKTVEVDLIPTGDAPGSGSRISLAALRLLGASLTDLPEVTVFGA